MAQRLLHHWQAIFWRGAVALLFGIAALTWPILTVSALLMLFGAFAILDGGLALLTAVRESPQSRWSLAILLEGVAGAVVGAVALFAPRVAQGVVTLLLSGWAVVTGVLEIAAASTLEGARGMRTALMLGGAASVLAGGFLLARPLFATVAIATVLGAYAATFGVLLLVVAWRLRRDARREQHRRLA